MALLKKHFKENVIPSLSYCEQGCQTVSFQTKNLNLGKLWRALDWKMWIWFKAI
jgi:hypothetical protein